MTHVNASHNETTNYETTTASGNEYTTTSPDVTSLSCDLRYYQEFYFSLLNFMLARSS